MRVKGAKKNTVRKGFTIVEQGTHAELVALGEPMHKKHVRYHEIFPDRVLCFDFTCAYLVCGLVLFGQAL